MWKVPKMWEDGRCWIIGGGPSLTDEFDIPDSVVQEVRETENLNLYSEYMKPLHDEHVIGINTAYQIGNWIEIVFFGDSGFYLKNRQRLADFPGLKVSCSPRVRESRFSKDGVKYLRRDKSRPKGISEHRTLVSWNGNSGMAAISMAVSLGVKEIILLGFDMTTKGNYQHWHNVYRKVSNPKKLPFHRHMMGLPLIKKDAKRLGVKIYNASQISVIKEFKRVRAKDLL